MIFWLFTLLVFVTASPATAQWLLDGDLSDWPEDALTVADRVGDSAKPCQPMGNDGRDLTSLRVRVDRDNLYVGIGFSGEERGDEEAGLLLLIDADRDGSTGVRRAGLGCELVWDIGLRTGEVHLDGFSGPIEGAEELREFLGILVAPTVTHDAVEVVLPRGDHELFEDRAFYLVVHDERSDDRAPDDGSFTLVWPTDATPVESIPLERHPDAAVRLGVYNIEHGGLFVHEDAARQESLQRMLRTMDADMWMICESWDHDAAQVRARLGEVLGRDLSTWSGVRHDGGNVLLSRFPVRDSWEVIDDVDSDEPRNRHRLTAALVATPERDALFVVNHWRCCDNDAARQVEADGLVRFLRDAFTSGGRLDLPADTPVVMAGDFNLVGLRDPLDTLLTGDIADEVRFGPDFAELGLRDVPARHPQAPWLHTWHVPSSSFGAGRLDWVFVRDAQVDVLRSYVLDTTHLDDALLSRHGLRRDDARTASDHFPLVVDLDWK